MDPKIDSDNALAEKTIELVDRLRPHANAIVMAVGGAALAVLAWLLVSNQTTAGRAQSWDAFLDAVASDSQPMLVDSLGDVIRRYPGTPAAQWSEVVLADVAAGTDDVTITLHSPAPSGLFPAGGDAAAMIGAAANYPCVQP